MDTAVPYHPGMLLGRSVNMKTMQPGFMLIGEDMNPTEQKVTLTTSQFSCVTTLKDVCDVLSIPPEYALKVRAGIVKNELVESCLENLGKENQFKIIFKVTFLERKQYLSPDVVPVGSDFLDGQVKRGKSYHTTESLIAEAAADSESCTNKGDSSLLENLSGKSRGHNGTHWVKAIEIGNELVTILTVSCTDSEKLNELREKFLKYLKGNRGQLDRPKIEALNKLGSKIDKKLSKKYNADVCLDIQYGSFTELDKYPASMSGMVKTIDSFLDQCVGSTEISKDSLECKVESRVMRCKPGVDKKGSSASSSGHKMASSKNETCEKPTNSDTDDTDSFVVLDPNVTRHLHNLQVTLQPLVKDNDVAGSFSSFALRQYPQTTYTMFENVLKQIVNCTEAAHIIQEFLSRKRYPLETHVDEGNKVLKSIQNVHLLVLETVADLDFVCIPTENTLENVITTNPLTTVTDFIENATSKLPPGSDIDLLMIGNTGHGKSSTGNSILGQNKFFFSSYAASTTNHSGVGWAEIDGRVIKVVDTPGLCDTDNDDDVTFNDNAIKSFSEAIAFCPKGFHALLLIIRFGTKMTKEERKSIELLKQILGQAIISSHCIFVFTYGDNFETEMATTKTTFEDWCKGQNKVLKDIFQECDYRCVLFNNKATDPKVKKAQLIKLVSKVDSLKDSGTRYTNSLFEFAQRERQRIIYETNAPQMNEEIMRDMQLIIAREDINAVVNNASEFERFRNDLSRLKETVDNLNNKVAATESSQLSSLAHTLFDLLEILQGNMVDGSLDPDNPGESAGATSTAATPERGELTLQCQVAEIQMANLKTYYRFEITPMNDMIGKTVTEPMKEKVKEKGCFPGSSVVVLSNGKSTTLEELCVGDKVLVRDKTGSQSFDTVYMFGHQELDASSEFLALKTASQTVYATSGHYVYCVQDGTELCVPAEKVHVGDCLLVATGDGLVPQSVQAVTYERKRGLFAPFTNSGNIIIDGALMSCYIDVLPATACHTLLWPVRQLYSVSPGALSYINGPSSQYPVPRWANAVLRLL